jgi:hypothetical protein
VNTEFKEFLKRVHSALSAAEPDDAENALFLFLSTLPPDDWRKYLTNKRKYCKEELDWTPGQPPDERILELLVRTVHILVLGAAIVTRGP